MSSYHVREGDGRYQESGLTPEEREQARGHWDSMMFAPSRVALEAARLSLGQASLPVQLAVMGSIGQLWLQDYQPSRNENPFLDLP